MKMEGRVWKFKDHVDTDLIIPARFLNVSEDRVLAENCFADLRPGFAGAVQTGDVLVAGVNFGLLNVSIWFPAIVIGVVTAALTTAGMLLSRFIGSRAKQIAQVLGGCVLIGIGLKILIEHLMG